MSTWLEGRLFREGVYGRRVPFDDELGPVAVVAWRAGWAADYGLVAVRVAEALGPLAVSVDHVGSTSVPGLAAKDVIDVQVTVASLDGPVIVDRLAGIGFRHRPEPWNRVETSFGQDCAKAVFAPPAGERRGNVHVRVAGQPNARFALLFRDYLRADEPARRSWGAFKARLAREVPDLYAYGQVKAPATEILMSGAVAWAQRTGWTPNYAPPLLPGAGRPPAPGR